MLKNFKNYSAFKLLTGQKENNRRYFLLMCKFQLTDISKTGSWRFCVPFRDMYLYRTNQPVYNLHLLAELFEFSQMPIFPKHLT